MFSLYTEQKHQFYRALLNVSFQALSQAFYMTQRLKTLSYNYRPTEKCLFAALLVEDPDFRCRRCLGNAPAIDGCPT